MLNRREVVRLSALGMAASASMLSAQASVATPTKEIQVKASTAAAGEITLVEYAPKSMLHAAETKVPRSRYPVIDWHTHLTHGPGMDKKGKLTFSTNPAECLAVMDRKNLLMMVDLTGGYGKDLRSSIAGFQTPHPDRFSVFTEPAYGEFADLKYAQKQGDMIHDAKLAGARGLKVLKTLGLVLRENVTTGPFVKIDDPRFDPMWEAVGDLNLPVAIHSSDPLDRGIERIHVDMNDLSHRRLIVALTPGRALFCCHQGSLRIAG